MATDDHLNLRQYAAIHAPITFRDVTEMLPDFDLAKPGDRRGVAVVLARMQVEYADSLIAALNGDGK